MKLTLSKSFILIILALQFACSSQPNSPEDVIRKFTENLRSGDCEEAKELCAENAADFTQASIDAGCESYVSEVNSVKCKIENDVAKCYCYEKVEGMSMTFPYLLKKIDGEWKITDYTKDIFSEEELEFD